MMGDLDYAGWVSAVIDVFRKATGKEPENSALLFSAWILMCVDADYLGIVSILNRMETPAA